MHSLHDAFPIFTVEMKKVDEELIRRREHEKLNKKKAFPAAGQNIKDADNARIGANVLTLKSPPTEKGILFARHAMAVFAAKGNMHEAAQIAKTHYGDESPVTKAQIGRASCRERVCQYVEISVVHGS